MYMLLLYEYVEQVQVLSRAPSKPSKPPQDLNLNLHVHVHACVAVLASTRYVEAVLSVDLVLESTCKCCSTCTKRTAVVYPWVYRRTWYSHSGVLGTPILVYLVLPYWCPIGPNNKQHKQQYDLYSIKKDINTGLTRTSISRDIVHIRPASFIVKILQYCRRTVLILAFWCFSIDVFSPLYCCNLGTAIQANLGTKNSNLTVNFLILIEKAIWKGRGSIWKRYRLGGGNTRILPF